MIGKKGENSMDVIDVTRAKELYGSEDYTAFMKYCLSFDEINDEKTLWQMGSCYSKGMGIDKNVLKAEEVLLKAAKIGHINSIMSLAILYCDEEEVRDIRKAIRWYKVGAKKGSASCMYNLAWIFHYIDGFRDIVKALHWYKQAANQGHIRGKYWYARLSLTESTMLNEEWAYQYLFECSVENINGALDLLTQKSESGSPIAQFFLGKYYSEKADIENHDQIALNWFKKSAILGYLPAQNIILINQSDITSQIVKEIKNDTNVIVQTTADNSRKLDIISNTLVSMNEKLAELKIKSFADDIEAEDEEISSALEKSADIINTTVKDSPADKLNEQTEHLIYLFGETTWERLLPETQQSLISSAYLLKECENMPPDFDYSGICITAVVALEKELKRVFSDNYIEYLKEVRKDKDDELPYLFQNKNYFFSLGKMAQLFGYDVENAETKNDFYARRMEEYLKTIVKKIYSYDPMLAFIDVDDPNCFILRCLAINKSYRCKAAHCGNVSYNEAIDCCYEIYGEATAHIEAKKHSAEIISLLRDLYSKLK